MLSFSIWNVDDYAWIFPGAALRGHPHAIWALQRPTDQYEGPNVHVTHVCVYYEYEDGFSYVLRLSGKRYVQYSTICCPSFWICICNCNCTCYVNKFIFEHFFRRSLRSSATPASQWPKNALWNIRLVSCECCSKLLEDNSTECNLCPCCY